MFRSNTSKGIVNINNSQSLRFPRELNQNVLNRYHKYFWFSLGDLMMLSETNNRVCFDVYSFSIYIN